MKTPDSILPNEPDYKPNAWHQYTLAELGALDAAARRA